MYSEWFGKTLTFEDSTPLSYGMRVDGKTISNFIAQLKYRNISISDHKVSAVRGRKIWALFNILGDPRLLYHSTEVFWTSDTITIKTHLHTWYGLATEHDKGIFMAEIEMLKRYLLTYEISDSPVKKAQVLRRKADLKTLLILIGIGILIPVVTIKLAKLIAILLTYIIRIV